MAYVAKAEKPYPDLVLSYPAIILIGGGVETRTPLCGFTEGLGLFSLASSQRGGHGPNWQPTYT